MLSVPLDRWTKIDSITFGVGEENFSLAPFYALN